MREAAERDREKDRQIQMLMTQLAKGQNVPLTFEMVSSNTRKSDNKMSAAHLPDFSGSITSPSKRNNGNIARGSINSPSKRNNGKMASAKMKAEKAAQMKRKSEVLRSQNVSNFTKKACLNNHCLQN